MNATHRRAATLMIILAVAVSGCGRDSVATSPPSDAEARLITRQTLVYERAGLTHDDAACLANVTGRMNPAGEGAKYVVGTAAQSEAIDRCDIPEEDLGQIGDYIDTLDTLPG